MNRHPVTKPFETLWKVQVYDLYMVRIPPFTRNQAMKMGHFLVFGGQNLAPKKILQTYFRDPKLRVTQDQTWGGMGLMPPVGCINLEKIIWPNYFPEIRGFPFLAYLLAFQVVWGRGLIWPEKWNILHINWWSPDFWTINCINHRLPKPNRIQTPKNPWKTACETVWLED